ncbi:phage gp6-like head-tail connector protein [Limosilactobacillus fermentum]|uniref:head-tail connector protein n=1 Tax=Limosilactobacillus fermentum TaxID=1613 RepID=UPI0021A574B7|nr:head-tail connector protein [Limosilactobacillus fermentum]MCT3436756.1 phage gp6-like head-tail connector protein [Limosilactobacillus fermentum]
MAVTIDDLKAVLYLDGDDEDALLQSYINAAGQFIIGAVGDEVPAFWDDSTVIMLHDLAVKSLAATYYQYRLSMSDTQTYQIDMTVNSILGQLRGRYASAKEDQDEASD